ncbi:RING finger protein nhl-1 [Durusdinium trenchii]|uniref:RING finger protein nhl-1 n=1 Tax=Durusdinium trenchii TaxID=1381693 RepID=A0ABP0RAW3_9DINO
MHLADLHPHQALRSLLDELPVSCPRGCGWTGRRDALKAHQAPGPGQCIRMRLEAAQAEIAFLSEAGHHLRDRDQRIAQLEARVAEQDQQVVDFGRQLLAKEVRGMAAISPIIRKKQGGTHGHRPLVVAHADLSRLSVETGAKDAQNALPISFGHFLAAEPVAFICPNLALHACDLARSGPSGPSWQKGHTEGNFAEFGIGLGGTSLFFGQMAKTYGRRLLADSFRGLPQPDPLLDEAYFAAGDFRTDGDEPLNGSKAFQELLENFGLEEHVEDALEKVWDLVVPGGIVVIDDFFHKVQGPARLLADQTGCRGIVPLLYVVPAYAVLVIKPSETGCTKPPFPRALAWRPRGDKADQCWD